MTVFFNETHEVEPKVPETAENKEEKTSLSEMEVTPSKEVENVTVVMQGPLSEIYTRALNATFKQNNNTEEENTEEENEDVIKTSKSLESYMTSNASSKFNFTESKEEQLENKKKAYVYITDSKHVNLKNGVNEIVKNVLVNNDLFDETAIMIKMDPIDFRNPSNRQLLLEHLLSSNGVKVIHRDSSLVNFIGTLND